MEPETSSTPSPQVLKEATCHSLSAQSTLTYQLGTTPDGTIHFRIVQNSCTGIFCSEWTSLHAVLDLLHEQEGPFIWSVLCPLFEGRSVNTACFLMAVLLAEKIVQSSKEKPRRYELADPKGFMAKVKALMAPKEKTPKKGGKKPPPDAPKADPAIDPPTDTAEPIEATA
jgi:hypothetical protein